MSDEEITDEELDHEVLYNSSEVAELFRVDPKTVSRWHSRGWFDRYNVQVYFTIGGHRRWRAIDVHRLLDQLYNEGLEETERNRIAWELEHSKDDDESAPPTHLAA